MSLLLLLMNANGRGYATYGKPWMQTYHPFQILAAKTELANCDETRILNDHLSGNGNFIFA